MYICRYVNMYMCIYGYRDMYLYICMCICMCMCVYVYVHVLFLARLPGCLLVLLMCMHICTLSAWTSIEIKSWELQTCDKLSLPNNKRNILAKYSEWWHPSMLRVKGRTWWSLGCCLAAEGESEWPVVERFYNCRRVSFAPKDTSFACHTKRNNWNAIQSELKVVQIGPNQRRMMITQNDHQPKGWMNLFNC